MIERSSSSMSKDKKTKKKSRNALISERARHSDKAKRTTCLYIKGIPTTLKNYYKAYCAKKEITMAEDTLRHMKDVTSVARQIDEDNE